MRFTVYLLACLFLVSGCAYTPEQRAWDQEFARNMQQAEQGLQSQQQAAPKTCTVIELDKGVYSQSCQ